MSEQHWSFCVGSKFGPRSARWIITFSGGDVYVSTERARREWHVSLHASGRWHLKLHASREKGKRPIVRTHLENFDEGKYPVGLYIAIPDACLRPASVPDSVGEPNMWIDRPPYDGGVEIAIARWQYTEVPEEWPGKAAGTILRCAFRHSETEFTGVLTRHFAADHPIAIAMAKEHSKAVAGHVPVVLDSPERRGYIFGQNRGGGIRIQEYAID